MILKHSMMGTHIWTGVLEQVELEVDILMVKDLEFETETHKSRSK